MGISIEKQREMLKQAEREKKRRKGKQKPIEQRWKEESESLMQSHQKQCRTTNLNDDNNKHNK